MLQRNLAPAGTRIEFSDFRRWAAYGFSRKTSKTLHDFLSSTGIGKPYLVSSGRAALVLSLQAMHMSRPDRNEVILPAYTCYSVPASIVRAGLKIRVADIDPTTLAYDKNSLLQQDYSRVLAIIATNLYGFPDDLVALTEIAKLHGTFLIDDAAQSMGAKLYKRASGSFGDIGIFSLDKGKAITTIQGGVILNRNADLEQSLLLLNRDLPSQPFAQSAYQWLALVVYSIFLRPGLYDIPANIPSLELGQTRYSEQFLVTKYPRTLAGMALALANRLQQIVAARRSIGSTLRELISELPEFDTIRPVTGAEPSYLRFPMLVSSPQLRKRVVSLLSSRKLGLSTSYPDTINKLSELGGHIVNNGVYVGGESVASSIITLPTHGYVSAGDIKRMESGLRECLYLAGQGTQC